MNNFSEYFYITLFLLLIYYVIEIVLKIKFKISYWINSEVPSRLNIIAYTKYWINKIKSKTTPKFIRYLITAWLFFYFIIILITLFLILLVLSSFFKHK
jgi:hypothetical protein